MYKPWLYYLHPAARVCRAFAVAILELIFELFDELFDELLDLSLGPPVCRVYGTLLGLTLKVLDAPRTEGTTFKTKPESNVENTQ